MNVKNQKRRVEGARRFSALAAVVLLAACGTGEPPPAPSPTPTAQDGPSWADAYAAWSNGPNPAGDRTYWPIGVWLQNPDRELAGTTSAAAYSKLGINLDVMVNAWPGCAWCPSMESELVGRPWDAGMWSGGGFDKTTFPGIERVRAREELGARVKMWGLDDEADMRRAPETNNPSVYPANYRAFGDKVRAADAEAFGAGSTSTRPVYSNFGKGMAVPNWVGYHAETPGGTGSYASDMREYCASSDIVSVDFYGWTDPWEPASQRGAWTYGRAVDSARANCGPDKLIWGFVEGSHPWQESAATAPGSTITPDQIEAAVWNVVAHGANGLVYFAHHFDKTGTVYEDGLLRLPKNAARVAEVNADLAELAPVLNSRDSEGVVSVSSTGGVPVTARHKVSGSSRYVIAVADGSASLPLSGATTATFDLSTTATVAEVVGEDRRVPIAGGRLVDQFGPYGHHVYRFPA